MVKDNWDKNHIILSLFFLCLTAFGTLIIAFDSIQKVGQDLNNTISNLRNCQFPYIIDIKSTYKGVPTATEIEMENIYLEEVQKFKTDDSGEYVLDILNFGWSSGSRLKITACYQTICDVKEIVIDCSKGGDRVNFDL